MKDKYLYVPQGTYGELTADSEFAGMYTADMGPCRHVTITNTDTNHSILCHVDDRTDLQDLKHGVKAWIDKVLDEGGRIRIHTTGANDDANARALHAEILAEARKHPLKDSLIFEQDPEPKDEYAKGVTKTGSIFHVDPHGNDAIIGRRHVTFWDDEDAIVCGRCTTIARRKNKQDGSIKVASIPINTENEVLTREQIVRSSLYIHLDFSPPDSPVYYSPLLTEAVHAAIAAEAVPPARHVTPSTERILYPTPHRSFISERVLTARPRDINPTSMAMTTDRVGSGLTGSAARAAVASLEAAASRETAATVPSATSSEATSPSAVSRRSVFPPLSATGGRSAGDSVALGIPISEDAPVRIVAAARAAVASLEAASSRETAATVPSATSSEATSPSAVSRRSVFPPLSATRDGIRTIAERLCSSAEIAQPPVPTSTPTTRVAHIDSGVGRKP